MRMATELLHIAAGLAVTLAIAWLSAWAVPQAAYEIEIIGYVAMAFILGMGLKPLHAARAADRAQK